MKEIFERRAMVHRNGYILFGAEGWEDKTKLGEKAFLEYRDAGWNAWHEALPSGEKTLTARFDAHQEAEALVHLDAAVEKLRAKFGGWRKMFNGFTFREARGPGSLRHAKAVAGTQVPAYAALSAAARLGVAPAI